MSARTTFTATWGVGVSFAVLMLLPFFGKRADALHRRGWSFVTYALSALVVLFALMAVFRFISGLIH
jgi:phosphoglycerol transferase MdoB-like AlkP superfamily enzyme